MKVIVYKNGKRLGVIQMPDDVSHTEVERNVKETFGKSCYFSIKVD